MRGCSARASNDGGKPRTGLLQPNQFMDAEQIQWILKIRLVLAAAIVLILTNADMARQAPFHRMRL
jgi:hypothetical protein